MKFLLTWFKVIRKRSLQTFFTVRYTQVNMFEEANAMFIIIHHSTLEFIRRFDKHYPEEEEKQDFPSFWQLFNDASSSMIIKKLPKR